MPDADRGASPPSDPSAGPGWWRYDLPLAPPDRDATAARLWLAGATGVWERPEGLSAWFADADAEVPSGGRWSHEPDRDWQAEWKATIAPVRAGRFLVVPSWLAATTPTDDDDTVLVLDPGRAFGSGHHATTTLCLELLDHLDVDGRTVADVGCGTGVLAIAAARRGANAVAVDVDPDAVEVTLANATANDVTLTAALGSVDALPGPAEVVLANLVTDVVVALADRLVAATRGTLVVSGIATEREPRARAALTAAGAVVEEARHRDGWVALRLRPTAPHDAPGGRPAAPEGPGDDPSTGPGPLGDDTATGRRG